MLAYSIDSSFEERKRKSLQAVKQDLSLGVLSKIYDGNEINDFAILELAPKRLVETPADSDIRHHDHQSRGA